MKSRMIRQRILSLICYFLTAYISLHAQPLSFLNDQEHKALTFGNDDLSFVLNYDHRAEIPLLVVNGQPVISGQGAFYSMIRTATATYSTRHLQKDPVVTVANNKAIISGIVYGDENLSITENWNITVLKDRVSLGIQRRLSRSVTAEAIGFPAIQFSSMDTWEGAYQDYGGLAWFYLFNKERDTYGVHSSSSRFWNSRSGNGLTIEVSAPGQETGMTYSRSTTGQLDFSVVPSKAPLQYRFDPDTRRRRYVRDTTDVWAPISIPASTSSQTITLQYFRYENAFGRGDLKGVDQQQVSAVLNTIARIGVIDKEHFGGNSWHTPYGPICLHEQYIAQMGIAINDNTYLKGYQQCLDFYRDNAFKPDGRVWPRWAYSNEDAMPKAFTDKGLYEAQWGYLLDSNPDFVTNVSELYDQTGDLNWVRGQQKACERALDWILKRDSNANGLVEMMNDSYQDKRGSDWIDIIWAAYENAFVNAKLYHALDLWSGIEQQIGNTVLSNAYAAKALQLKTSFNKPTTQGGFWDEQNNCYVHWRDKDGSIHGTNMVTPVNFMAIAYGICDDENRKKIILDSIESQMEQEHLFFWPLCMRSYAAGEGNDWQFPFPNYENGDIFLSWGAVGVKAYAVYKPELALKYVKNVLGQYAKDGLAFQRYGRAKQDGLGDDILSGNCLSVVGLYQSIYGVNPKYNRLYLDPHITSELAGTELNYRFRGQLLRIGLDQKAFTVSNDKFSVTAPRDFGFFSEGSRLQYFNGSADKASLVIDALHMGAVGISVRQWDQDLIAFTVNIKRPSGADIRYAIHGLKPGSNYDLIQGGRQLKRLDADSKGGATFVMSGMMKETEVRLERR